MTLDGLETEPLVERPDLTEDSLALEFTRRHGNDLRYVNEWGRWLRWDGCRWLVDRTIVVHNLGRSLVRGYDVKNRKLRARLRAASTVHAIVSLARCDPVHARVTEQFDADPWLLNTPAGTVDLRTGATRSHARRDGITKVTSVAPADTSSGLWESCLATWTKDDTELIAFLQRLCGYWATGSVREEKFAIVYGRGGNGKTKFIEAVRGALGPDYVTGVAMETLVVTRGEQHPTDLADLRGKRLAIASETEEGRHLAESRIKALSGGDRIRARHMRRDFFEFDPTHKIVIVGNHRPELRNADEAMRRRLLLIPFDAAIPPEMRDPLLADKLAADRPGILRWILNGARQWDRRGLDPPQRVLAATEDYFASSDAVMRWIEERGEFGANLTMTKAAAFDSWKRWAEAGGEYVGMKRWLCERVAQLPGIDEARLGNKRDKAFLGIGLRPEGE